MSKITMQDIADALGTSRVTVWKTFNHRAGVSDEMKEKILEKAHELGYDKFSSEQYQQTDPYFSMSIFHFAHHTFPSFSMVVFHCRWKDIPGNSYF